jgi:glycosyltransferase involved in cell wall biosynthesis
MRIKKITDMKYIPTEGYNILYTTSFSDMAGGGQWSLYYLVKHLNKDIFHPIVLCPEEGDLAEKMRAAGADMIFLRMGRIRHLNLFAVWKLTSIIKKQKINLVHTDSSTETFYAGIAARIMGIPIIWHIRVSEHECFLDRILSLLSTRLILVAEALSSRFKWLKNTQKMVVVYNGIDIEEFDTFRKSSFIREEFNIKKDTILLGFIGRIEKRKGPEYLISAMKNVDNAKLILVGKGKEGYLKRVKKLCEKSGVLKRVINAGYRKDIPSILKEIDIIVFPTISGEGFSRVILEAMAAAKPVIATDDAGNKEAVLNGITGYIVPAKDTIALGIKINELTAGKEKREQMGSSGRQRVEEMFTMERNIRKIEKLYFEVLKDR